MTLIETATQLFEDLASEHHAGTDAECEASARRVTSHLKNAVAWRWSSWGGIEFFEVNEPPTARRLDRRLGRHLIQEVV